MKYLLTVREESARERLPGRGRRRGADAPGGFALGSTGAAHELHSIWKVVQGSLSQLFFSVSTEDGRGHCFREFALYTAEELTFKTPLLYPGEVSVLPSKRHCKVDKNICTTEMGF